MLGRWGLVLYIKVTLPPIREFCLKSSFLKARDLYCHFSSSRSNGSFKEYKVARTHPGDVGSWKGTSCKVWGTVGGIPGQLQKLKNNFVTKMEMPNIKLFWQVRPTVLIPVWKLAGFCVSKDFSCYFVSCLLVHETFGLAQLGWFVSTVSFKNNYSQDTIKKTYRSILISHIVFHWNCCHWSFCDDVDASIGKEMFRGRLFILYIVKVWELNKKSLYRDSIIWFSYNTKT